MCSKLCVNNKKDLTELRKIHNDLTEKMRVKFWTLESLKKLLSTNAEKLDVDGLKKAKKDINSAKKSHSLAFNMRLESQYDNDGFYIYSNTPQKKDGCTCGQEKG